MQLEYLRLKFRINNQIISNLNKTKYMNYGANEDLVYALESLYRSLLMEVQALK